MTTWTIDTGQIRHRVMVGSVDYSAQLDTYQLTDSHIDQSGIVKTQGSITFTRGAIPIDNWGLSAIPDGTAVTIDVWLDGRWQRHPRGALRSVGSTYGELDDQLVLGVECILLARSFAEIPDVFASGVTPGSSTGAQTVASRLLAHGGIPSVINSSTGAFSFLDRPQMSGSAIETAGKILASLGAIAWTDSLERVQIADLSLDPIGRIWSGPAYKFVMFERTKVGQPPTEEIKVTGSYREIHVQKNPAIGPPVREYAPSKWGGLQLQKESVTTTTIDFGGAIETTETVSRINAEVVYRAWNPGGNGLVPSAEISTKIRKFDKNDTGYLLTATETVRRERGLALAPYLDWLHKNNKNAFASVNRYGRIIAEQREEVCKYNSNGFLVSREVTTRNTLANLLGELGDPNWKLAASLDLGQPVVFEKTIETWEERIPGQWVYDTKTWVAQGRASQGRTGVIAAIEMQKSKAEYVAAVIQAQQLMIQKVDPVNSNSGQGDPPDPERIPAQFRSESKEAESIAYFPGHATNWGPRRSQMQIPYLPDRWADSSPPSNFCQYYGKLYGGIQQAQWRTARIALPITQWLIDGYRPWAAIDVIRHDSTDTPVVYTLAVSGSSWAGDREQCLVSIDGALLGERFGAVTNGDVITSPGVLVPPYDSREEDSVSISSVALSVAEPEDSYADLDVSRSAILSEVTTVEIDRSTASITTSVEEGDDDSPWVWFF